MILARYQLSACQNDVVIEDVRFENEAALIRELGGVVVHILRPGMAADDTHASEAGVMVDPRDLRIDNSSSTAVFCNSVLFALGLLKAVLL